MKNLSLQNWPMQPGRAGILLKREEVIKAFSVLSTLLLAVYLMVFKTLKFIEPGILPALIVSLPLILSFVMLGAAYNKKLEPALFIMTWLLPAVMVLASFCDPNINYAKVIMVSLISLLFLERLKYRRFIGFLYLTVLYTLIQMRYHYNGTDGINGQHFWFDVVMIPVFSLVFFIVLSGLKRELMVYHGEVDRQKKSLEKKNTTLEQMVTFSEAQRAKLKRTVLFKERLISILSHDVRVPLNGFKMLITGYEKGYINDKIAIEGILEAKQDIEHIDNMVVDLLNWFKNDTSCINNEMIGGEKLKEVIESVLSIYTLCAKNKGLMIIVDTDMPNGKCLSVPRRELEMVMRNLLSNAMKFSNQGGTIMVSLKAAQGADVAEMSVRDFGVGMFPSKLMQINGKPGLSTMGTMDEMGLGIGLSIVFDVINNYNLQYNIESEREKGTEFMISIPLMD